MHCTRENICARIMTHLKKMGDTGLCKTWFDTAKVLTKAIQACLTNLYFYSRNAGAWKRKDSLDSTALTRHPVEFIFPVGKVGIEG